jgi:hypothetical protein
VVGSTFCFPGKDEIASFDEPISSFFVVYLFNFVFLQPKIKMSYKKKRSYTMIKLVSFHGYKDG